MQHYLPQMLHLVFERALGLIAITYLIGLSFYGMHVNTNFKETLKLRFENVELIEQLRIKNIAAEQKNIAKSKFLAAASHDLRQPLYALSLFTSVLDELIQYPKVRTVVNQINASVDALQNLFNALLDISQLDAGVMKAEKTDFDLHPLFLKLSNNFDPVASQKDLRIVWPTASYAVHSDPVLLERILRNFISNAIRYTEHGDISISCIADEGKVRIKVADTGVGIPEEEQQVIFDEFYQLNNIERDRSKGLGLGLAIVQRTARLLEHPIGVTSKSGHGSTFFIEVKRATISELPVTPATDMEDVITTENRTLMVVIDDENDIRAGTQSLFEQWNCDVIAAVDKDDAIAQLKLQDRLPNGIISDYRLSDTQTGIEAIHAIFKAFEITIPALIISGDIAVDSLRQLKSSEFQILHKPVATLKLRTFLRHVQLHHAKNTH